MGPAETLAVAALGAGVDLTDPDGLQRSLQRPNESLAA